jgi:hypothetical protein
MKTNMATARIGAALVGLAMISIFGTAKATLVEGFESGSLNGSEGDIGDAGITSSYFTINATQGSNQLLLTTINNTSDASSGRTHQFSDAVPNSSLDTFFGGLASTQPKDGTLTSQEGSGFSIDLGVLTAGTTISFDYDFLTDEAPSNIGGRNDFAYVVQNIGVSTTSTTITDRNTATFVATSGAGNPFALETGYKTFSLTVATTGDVKLGIGVSDATDKAGPSGLLVDNIQVNAPVPEPSTIAFSVAGAALLVALRRFRRNS